MDLLSVLPDFATKPYAHILPPLERGKITTVDLITLDTLEIAKRAHVPPADVRRLAARIVDALHADLGFENSTTTADTEPPSSTAATTTTTTPSTPNRTLGSGTTTLDVTRWNTVSTLDPALDALLGGGIPTGYVTEITGESGSGKTQFLLSILLSVQLPKSKGGLDRRAVYISTEHPLSTPRLSQLQECHPYLSSLPDDQKPSLENILAINAMDLETQDHILSYQLPVAIARYNVGLIVIDSITSNYRAEHSSNSMLALSARSSELAKLGQLLRNLAVKHDIAVVLANQVSDRFDPVDGYNGMAQAGFPWAPSQNTAVAGAGGGGGRESGANSPHPRSRTETDQQASFPSSSPAAISSSPFPAQEDDHFDGSYLIGNPARNALLSLLHQERFFTGWGDGVPPETGSLKTPALGFFWSTQIACRIALKKEDEARAVVMGDPAVQSQEQKRLKPSDQKAGEESEQGTGQEGTKPVQDLTSRPAPEFQRPETPQRITRRSMKLVFAPWTAGSTGMNGRRRGEVDFEIWKGGLRSI
ncbi:DNA recombination and repair protein Rad51 C-terminal [Penicillium riverlandense]|uniref:DNA recombination and repair protein Rad51 C-terminal n=1 Tax=Penicillium riverlandense TaxID=1903569 RepID=UPI0025467A1F|nr:DNA recombination and repair protein Rad51 C-terminal [Penicillium riverlandense]KAJ5832649.1 DNA recombination and repair protein Rad51 C-terminal [Penicillium riverlandense]